jgi:hypothetical protein
MGWDLVGDWGTKDFVSEPVNCIRIGQMTNPFGIAEA